MKAYKLFTMGYCALMGACGQPGVDVSGEPKEGSAVADGAAPVTSHAQPVEGVPSTDSVRASGAFAALTSSGAMTVDQLATAGTGAVGSPWSGWEAGLNALPPAIEIYFPAGYYAQATTIETKPGWTLRGAGQAASVIVSGSGFTGDALQSISPYNSSTAVRLAIADLQILGTNTSPTGAGIDIVGGTFATIDRVVVMNYKYGAVLDQAELVDIASSEFTASITTAAAGVWIVNGAEHQAQHVPGVPTSPVPSLGFSNRIGIRESQFNSINYTGIADDGGSSHVFEGNNYNGGGTAVYLAGVSGGRVSGSEMGLQNVASIISSDVTFQGHASGPGANVGLYVGENGFMLDGAPAVRFDRGAQVTLTNNVVSTDGSAFTGLGNLQELSAFGNRQLGTGALYDGDPAGGIVLNGGVGIQTAHPGAELEINGGARLFTNKPQPSCTVAARGEIWFSQGGVNVKDTLLVCAKGAANNYAWRVLF